MITRELQSQGSILSVLAQKSQSNPTGFMQSEASDFGKVLADKKVTVNYHSKKETLSQTNDMKTKAPDSQEATMNKEPVKANETKVTQKPVKETHSTKETKSEDVSSDNETNEALEQLKEELKKKLGLSDEEVSMLLQMMQIDVDALPEDFSLDQFTSESLSSLTELLNQKQSIEISTQLDQTITSEEYTEFAETFNQALETMKSLLGDQNSKKAPEPLEALLSSLNADSVTLETENDKTVTIDLSELKAMMKQPQAIETNQTVVGQAVVAETDPLTTDTVSSETDLMGQEETEAAALTDKMADKTPDTVKETVTVKTEGDQIIVETTQVNQNQSMQVMSSQTQVQTLNIPKQDVFNQVMDAVKNNMTMKLDDNGTSMLVKLQPEQLGNVELKVSIHKGVVLAEINVENEAVKAAVESNLDNLKNSLSNKGYQVNQISVSIDSGRKEESQESVFDRFKQAKKNKKVEGVDFEEDILDSLYDDVSRMSTSTIDYFA